MSDNRGTVVQAGGGSADSSAAGVRCHIATVAQRWKQQHSEVPRDALGTEQLRVDPLTSCRRIGGGVPVLARHAAVLHVAACRHALMDRIFHENAYFDSWCIRVLSRTNQARHDGRTAAAGTAAQRARRAGRDGGTAASPIASRHVPIEKPASPSRHGTCWLIRAAALEASLTTPVLVFAVQTCLHPTGSGLLHWPL